MKPMAAARVRPRVGDPTRCRRLYTHGLCGGRQWLAIHRPTVRRIIV